MIHVEVQQRLRKVEARKYRVIGRVYCECTLHHAQDGEFLAYTESFEFEGAWPEVLVHLHQEYGDDISRVEVRA